MIENFKESEKSPLEKLVEIQQAHLNAIKISPKDRLVEKTIINAKVVTPEIEDTIELDPLDELLTTGALISDSSVVLNFNFNIDSEAMDKAIEKSAQVAKKLAAAGAAMLGTALIFGGTSGKKLNKVKIPVSPKTKVPQIRKI